MSAPRTPNDTLLVAGYGSLLSGYGLLAIRRGGGSELVARDAFPLALRNARRGLAKPSSHGEYLAMDIEPIDRNAPIAGRMEARSGPGEIGALGLEFDRRWAERIARREEYDPGRFVQLIGIADRAGQPLGEFLLAIARGTRFDLLEYRRALFAMLGYSSPGYIFHPLPLDDGRVAIIAIGSGFDGSGDPNLRSRRHEAGMDRLLGLPEALALGSLPIDREGQLGYFAECMLAAIHGIEVDDLAGTLDGDVECRRALAKWVDAAAAEERARFLKATSLDPARYAQRFGAAGGASLIARLTDPSPGQGHRSR